MTLLTRIWAALLLVGCSSVPDRRHSIVVAEALELMEPVLFATSTWNQSQAGTSFSAASYCDDAGPCVHVYFGEPEKSKWAAESSQWTSGNCEIVIGEFRHSPLEVVIAHELGHCLGLAHTEEPCADGRSDLMMPAEMPESEICEPTLREFREVYGE